MQFKDKINQSVAEAVSRIMNEKLHPNQQKIDVVDDEKIDGKDFAKLRKMKKEEVESIDEGTMTHITLGAKVKDKEGGYTQDVHHKGKKIGHIEAYKHRTGMRYGSHHDASGDATAGNRSAEESIADVRYAHANHLKSMKEEVENLDEVKMADLPSTKVQGRAYGASKPEPHAVDVLRGPKEKELKSIESEKKKPIKEDIELTLDDYLLEELVEFVMSEEFQQLDELSKSTLGSYVTKASKDLRSHSQMAGSKDTALMAHQMGYRRGEKSPIKGGTKGEKRVSSEIAKHQTKANNRTAGIAGAAQRLAKEEVELQEKLSASADAGDYIRDFKKSDAPQFQGKSPEKRRIMGIAAYLASKRGK